MISQPSPCAGRTDASRHHRREVKYVPGFFKIVDEILVNAADNKVSISSA